MNNDMIDQSKLEKDILDAIKWQPLLDKEIINVRNLNGEISLTGEVDTYLKKMDIEKTVRAVKGVNSIVDNIEVEIPELFQREDKKIAEDATLFLAQNDYIPHNKVKFKVDNGWLTLEGEVNQVHEKEAANESIHYITGIKGIINNILIIPQNENSIIN